MRGAREVKRHREHAGTGPRMGDKGLRGPTIRQQENSGTAEQGNRTARPSATDGQVWVSGQPMSSRGCPRTGLRLSICRCVCRLVDKLLRRARQWLRGRRPCRGECRWQQRRQVVGMRRSRVMHPAWLLRHRGRHVLRRRLRRRTAVTRVARARHHRADYRGDRVRRLKRGRRTAVRRHDDGNDGARTRRKRHRPVRLVDDLQQKESGTVAH